MIHILINIQELKFLQGSEYSLFNFSKPFPKDVVFKATTDTGKVVIVDISVKYVSKGMSFFHS